MKIGRRGFLGGFIGAAAAGPAGAAKAATSMFGSGLASATGLGSSSYYDNTASQGICSIGPGDYRASLISRIADLRGMSQAERRDRYGSYRDEADRVAVLSLRSVADCQKARMIYERGINRAVERDLSNALRELAGIDRQGGLR